MNRVEETALRGIARLHDRHQAVFVIVSPPRCSSTAVARLLWEHPTVRHYCHEPFEVTYYDGRGLDEVLAKLDEPLDLSALTSERPAPGASSLVIKEMPYQVGERLAVLHRLATQPLIFLIRDPRLSIASRIRKKQEVGDDPGFPKIETGWQLLAQQVEETRRRGIPHVIVDTGEVRNAPREVLPRLFERLGVEYSPRILDWRPCPKVELDNLGGRHRHLYRRVLESDGLQPAVRQPPEIESFPEAGGWRRHVRECLEIYRNLRADRIEPARASAGVS